MKFEMLIRSFFGQIVFLAIFNMLALHKFTFKLSKNSNKNQDAIINLKKIILGQIEYQLNSTQTDFKLHIETVVGGMHSDRTMFMASYEQRLEKDIVGNLTLKYLPNFSDGFIISSVECSLKGNVNYFAQQIYKYMGYNCYDPMFLNTIAYLIRCIPLSGENGNVNMQFETMNVKNLLTLFYKDNR